MCRWYPRTLLPLPLLLVAHFAQTVGALTTQDESCHIFGDPDVYGLGIRIGIYVQWLSLFVASFFAKETIHTIRTNGNILSIAILINTFYGASQDADLVMLEWIIVMFLILLLVATNVPMTTAEIRSGAASFAVGHLITASLLLSAPWLFFTQYTKGRRHGCSVKLYLWVPFDAYDARWMTAGKALSCIAVPVAILVTYLSLRWLELSLAWNSARRAQAAARFTGCMGKKEKFLVKTWIRIMSLSMTLNCMSFVEILLEKNEIRNVNSLSSSGQLIALIIGIFSFSTVIYSMWRKVLVKVEEEGSFREAGRQWITEMRNATRKALMQTRNALRGIFKPQAQAPQVS